MMDNLQSSPHRALVSTSLDPASTASAPHVNEAHNNAQNTRFVRLTPELLDLVLLANRKLDMEGMGDTQAFRAYVLRQRVAIGIVDGGYVIGAGGLVQHWHGRVEGWWVMTRFATRRHLTQCTRHSTKIMDDLQTDPAYRRIEMTVRARHSWRHSFAESMGFKREATLSAWGPEGEDWEMYARIAGGVQNG